MADQSELIYVFGATLEAKEHASGCALFAARFYGARHGLNDGFNDRSYAIPILNIGGKSIEFDRVWRSVNTFIEFAKERPQYTFFVADILAAATTEQARAFVKLFGRAPKNCLLCDELLALKSEMPTC